MFKDLSWSRMVRETSEAASAGDAPRWVSKLDRLASAGLASELAKALEEDGGADAQSASRDGLTPLMRAIEGGHAECVMLLIPHSELSAPAHRGMGVLAKASVGPSSDVLEAVVKAFQQTSHDGASLWSVAECGGPALMSATESGRAKNVEALLALGADAKWSDAHGITPLMKACWAENIQAIHALADVSDRSAVNDSGQKAMDMAMETKNPQVMMAAARGNDLWRRDDKGFTPLLLVAIDGGDAVVGARLAEAMRMSAPAVKVLAEWSRARGICEAHLFGVELAKTLGAMADALCESIEIQAATEAKAEPRSKKNRRAAL